METIYKIKIRSNKNSLVSYPSERRYSASIVLGLAIIYTALSSFALICAVLTLIQITPTKNNDTLIGDEELENSEICMEQIPFVSNISIAATLLFFALLFPSIGGFLAGKRWYIDRNIRWFFCASVLGMLISALCTFLVIWTIVSAYQYTNLKKDIFASTPFYNLAFNVAIASCFAFVWSTISTIIAYRGMMNPYQDDTDIYNNLGQIPYKPQVKPMPPDIITHFTPRNDAKKYWPNIKNAIPKEECEEKVQNNLTTNSNDIEKEEKF